MTSGSGCTHRYDLRARWGRGWSRRRRRSPGAEKKGAVGISTNLTQEEARVAVIDVSRPADVIGIFFVDRQLPGLAYGISYRRSRPGEKRFIERLSEGGGGVVLNPPATSQQIGAAFQNCAGKPEEIVLLSPAHDASC